MRPSQVLNLTQVTLRV